MARLFDDASSQYIEREQAVALSAAYPITMAAWFNSDTTSLGQTLLWLGDKDDAAKYFALLAAGHLSGDPVGFAAVQPGSGQFAESTSGYSANTWHHACGVGISSTERWAYIDGGNGGSEATDITPPYADFDRTSIGRTAISAGPIRYMSGAIVHAAIWNVALSTAEVAALGAGADPRTIRPESLVAYWPLIRTDQDIVGGYDMTATNNPTWTDGPGTEMGPARVHIAMGGGITLPEWVSPDNHAAVTSTPTLTFTTVSFTGVAHFHLELDKANTFDGGDYRSIKTNHGVTGWEYWNGGSWESFPTTGLSDAYSGNDVRYTVQTELSGGTWYRRVRQEED